MGSLRSSCDGDSSQGSLGKIHDVVQRWCGDASTGDGDDISFSPYFQVWLGHSLYCSACDLGEIQHWPNVRRYLVTAPCPGTEIPRYIP
jgi:hypothetical protein